MLRDDVVIKLRKNIQKNWGKVNSFRQIDKNDFNCYMFAICCTEPTEILTAKGTYVSTIGENISYFGAIGHISGTLYKTLEEYKQAFINDLNVLGISAEECFDDFTVTGDDIKIAFYSNFEEGLPKEEEEFHFLRFIPSKNYWMGKEGFPGGYQKLKRGSSIEEIEVIDQKRIGLYRLRLISKSTSRFSDEMNQLIRQIAELSVKEGYNIATVKNAISSEFYACIPDNQSFEFKNLELEQKLLALLEEKIPAYQSYRNDRLLFVCELYYVARKKSAKIKLNDFTLTIAKRFSLKEASARAEIHKAGNMIRWWIFDDKLPKGYKTKDVLEKFYLTYMK